MTMPVRARRRSVVPVALLAGALALAACSSSSAGSSVRSDSTDVPFTSCDKVACTGTMDGAKYEIVMPAKWNGTLLLYSHGYRQAGPAPPDFARSTPPPSPRPAGARAQKEVGQALLDKGYAIAGSAYASNGWAVADGVKADEDAATPTSSTRSASPTAPSSGATRWAGSSPRCSARSTPTGWRRRPAVRRPGRAEQEPRPRPRRRVRDQDAASTRSCKLTGYAS